MEPNDAEHILTEAARRRTFAIISHPDAGKTTLTEKFLLYGGALREAGSVQAREGRRSATSDWMEMEQKRGISISSTVLQLDHRDHHINLLDTPGHRDFSEDTYRTLTATDAAVMVLDAAKGIEPQTRKLFEVARSRNTPILTFVNKLDRPGMEILEILDDIETSIGLRPTPVTWPVGRPGDFRGVIDRRDNSVTRFTRVPRGTQIAPEEELTYEQAAEEEADVWEETLGGKELMDAIEADLDVDDFLAGESTPVFFGSALTNFGVRHLLDAVVDLAPAPHARIDVKDEPRGLDSPFSAVVFKVQANIDRNHHDRVAYARVCSGRFDRGMQVTSSRTNRPFATKYAASVQGKERTTIEEAFPGDVVGLVNANDLIIGDTLYDQIPVTFPPMPSFAPEHFARARPKDPSKFKQFRKGMAQLDEEGVIQLLRHPVDGDAGAIVAVVGQLQLEVFASRMAAEFNAEADLVRTSHHLARITDKESADRLAKTGRIEIMVRPSGTLYALFENEWWLQRMLGEEHPPTLLPIGTD